MTVTISNDPGDSLGLFLLPCMRVFAVVLILILISTLNFDAKGPRVESYPAVSINNSCSNTIG